MITIDKMSRAPLYEQLVSQFELGILSGEITEQGQLPPVRMLSQQLGVNPNTLQRAYSELERRGLCYSVPGSGRFITREALETLHGRMDRASTELETLLNKLKQENVDKQRVLSVVARVFSEEDATLKDEVINT